MNWVHEVDADDIGRALRRTAYFGDGNARRVGAETDFGRHDPIEIFVNRLFGAPIFGDILDHELAGQKIFEAGRKLKALECVLFA